MNFYDKLRLREEDARMLAAIIVVVALARFARASIYGLASPVDVEYDTPNLFTIRAIQAGRNVYAPEFYLAPPFGLTIYTPLYHYIVTLKDSADIIAWGQTNSAAEAERGALDYIHGLGDQVAKAG